MNELEKLLQEEVERYKAINKYTKDLREQAAPDPNAIPPAPAGAGAGAPPAGDVADIPPEPGQGEEPEAPDTNAPLTPDMPEEPSADDTTEEIDITDLVNMTKNIKQELESSKDNKDNVIAKMDGIFNKLNELEGMSTQMDSLINRIEELGTQVSEMKPKTPQEKLEMRSLDSYPFNEKPDEFFAEKQNEMKKTGKNEYVLTKDDVLNYNKEDIKQSFNDRLNKDDVSL